MRFIVSGGMGLNVVVVPLIALLIQGCSVCHNAAKIKAMASQRQEAELTECLEEDASWVREETALSMGRLKSPSAARRLESLVTNNAERDYVRAAAARALGQIKDPGSFQILVGALAAPGSAPELKLALIESVCSFKGDQNAEAVQAISPLRDDEDIIVAAAAEKKVRSQCGRAQ